MKNSISIIGLLKNTTSRIRNLMFSLLIFQSGYLIQAYIVLYLINSGFSAHKAGLSLSILAGASVLGTLASPFLDKQYGSKNTIIISGFGLGVFTFIIPFLSNISFFLTIVAVGFAGFSTQISKPSIALILSKDLKDEYKTMGFSLMRVVLNTGASVAPLLATIILRIDWDYIFFLNSFSAFLFTALVFWRVDSDKTSKQQEDTVEDNRDVQSAWLILLKNKNFWFFNMAMFLSSMVYMQLFVTVPLSIEKYGYSLDIYSFVLIVYSIATILLELKISSISSRFLPWIPSTIGTTLLCLGVASFALTIHLGYLMLLSSFFLVLGSMTSGPVMFAYPARQDILVRRQYISSTQACFSLGNAVGPFVGVWLFESYHLLVFAYCAVIGVICAVLLIWGMKPKHK